MKIHRTITGKMCECVFRYIMCVYIFMNYVNIEISLILNRNGYRNILKDLKQTLNRSRIGKE